ncbi:MAG: class I SAM-dependent methyltransferase [Thiohalocapsa sp.]
MTSISKHYNEHLGPVYAWSLGGIDAALQRGEAELTSIAIDRSSGGVAVDLGAGFGTHAIPLAQAEYRVLAIDSCALLLDQLQRTAGPLSIRCIEDDLLDFDRYLSGTAELILCLGDTLTHLGNHAAVEQLVAKATDALSDNGRLVVSFRDYSVALRGAARFIPVRYDDDRMLTCFLEYQDASVTVHDLLHERTDQGWELKISTYGKLRLSSAWIIQLMKNQGLVVREGPGSSGMIRLEGRRRSAA